MKMNAIIQSNLHISPATLDETAYAQAYCQAIWLEKFRLRNLAELLAAIFGGEKRRL